MGAGKKSKKKKIQEFATTTNADDESVDDNAGKQGGAIKGTSIRGMSEISEEDNQEVRMLKRIIRMQQEKVDESRRMEDMGQQLRSKETMRYNTKRNIGRRDPMGQQMVNQWVEGCFTAMKFLPPNFNKYSTRRNTPCGQGTVG